MDYVLLDSMGFDENLDEIELHVLSWVVYFIATNEESIKTDYNWAYSYIPIDRMSVSLNAINENLCVGFLECLQI